MVGIMWLSFAEWTKWTRICDIWSILCLYVKRMGDLLVRSWAKVRLVSLGRLNSASLIGGDGWLMTLFMGYFLMQSSVISVWIRVQFSLIFSFVRFVHSKSWFLVKSLFWNIVSLICLDLGYWVVRLCKGCDSNWAFCLRIDVNDLLLVEFLFLDVDGLC